MTIITGTHVSQMQKQELTSPVERPACALDARACRSSAEKP